MKKNDYSKRDYNKTFYWSGDKKDLRKSFPKWTMIAWALIYLLVGAIIFWYSRTIENLYLIILLRVIAGVFFTMSYYHLSYLWGGRFWGANK